MKVVAVRLDEQPADVRRRAAESRQALQEDSLVTESYRRITASRALEQLVP